MEKSEFYKLSKALLCNHKICIFKAVFKTSPHPNNFIAGRPKADLLVWLFGDFRCGVSLFIVILVYINIKIGKNRC